MFVLYFLYYIYLFYSLFVYFNLFFIYLFYFSFFIFRLLFLVFLIILFENNMKFKKKNKEVLLIIGKSLWRQWATVDVGGVTLPKRAKRDLTEILLLLAI